MNRACPAPEGRQIRFLHPILPDSPLAMADAWPPSRPLRRRTATSAGDGRTEDGRSCTRSDAI
jgi:hypothetical protein